MRPRLMVTRHFCDYAQPVRVACIGLDTEALGLVAMGESDSVEDGLLVRFERVCVLTHPANALERNSSDRTLRSLPCESLDTFEKFVKVGSQHLEVGDGGSKPLHATGKRL